MFKIGHYKFRAHSKEQMKQWIDVINKMIQDKEEYLKKHQIGKQQTGSYNNNNPSVYVYQSQQNWSLE